MNTTQQWLALVISATTVLALVGGWWRWLRPRYRRLRGEVVGIRDSILGREAITDSITGREIEPALPGMGVRMAGLEQAHTALEQSQARLLDAIAALTESNAIVANHEQRISALEMASVERVVMRAESAQAWRTIEKAYESGQPADDES
ncbi:hypothetical protein [uncultured Nocardioides sp.]|jgi:hypothetical protein|uniref:hypothetical protein n=1 Tax=uncultured Nocardioides sp. TaxID=198441 RepID=UPI00261B52D1|nr:hypothetical protein [uncultured Nocardioides sp.]HRD59388.1 hypothetical protein [Nocardioides sp.]